MIRAGNKKLYHNMKHEIFGTYHTVEDMNAAFLDVPDRIPRLGIYLTGSQLMAEEEMLRQYRLFGNRASKVFWWEEENKEDGSKLYHMFQCKLQ